MIFLVNLFYFWYLSGHSYDYFLAKERNYHLQRVTDLPMDVPKVPIHRATNIIKIMVDTKASLPSIHELSPLESGGSDARRGLDYQDDVAAAFCLEMVESDNLIQIQCETHDDITLVWQNNTAEEIEFVQVKKIDLDQLWSIAKLCERVHGKGSSILEKSLSRERCVEDCIFRMVTDVDVKKELALLTYDSNDSRRTEHSLKFRNLCDAVSKKIGDFKSPKDNDCVYWLHNAHWDVRESRQALRNSNLLLLHQLVLQRMGEHLFPDNANKVYDKLLHKVHDAAAPEKRANPKEHIIRSEELFKWLSTIVKQQLYPGTIGNDTLKQKMEEAGLSSTSISTAIDQRRRYHKERLSPTYLSFLDTERIESDITAEMHQAFSWLDAEEINDTGPQFHTRCLDTLKEMKNTHSMSVDTPLSFYQGYMYEMTNRCLHRFSREAI